MKGIAADGNSQLVIKVPSSQPGQTVTIQVLDENKNTVAASGRSGWDALKRIN